MRNSNNRSLFLHSLDQLDLNYGCDSQRGPTYSRWHSLPLSLWGLVIPGPGSSRVLSEELGPFLRSFSCCFSTLIFRKAVTATAERSSTSVQQMLIESFNQSIKIIKSHSRQPHCQYSRAFQRLLSRAKWNNPWEKKIDSISKIFYLMLKNGQNYQLTKGGKIGRTCYDS